MPDLPNTPITLTCAAAPGVFRLQSISGSEHLGTLYQYQLKLASESHDVDLVSLLGKALTVHMPLGNKEFRHFGGVISGIRRGEREFDHTLYYVTLSPEHELLSFSHDCRIFQNVTVVDVVKQTVDRILGESACQRFGIKDHDGIVELGVFSAGPFHGGNVMGDGVGVLGLGAAVGQRHGGPVGAGGPVRHPSEDGGGIVAVRSASERVSAREGVRPDCSRAGHGILHDGRTEWIAFYHEKAGATGGG